MNTFRYVVDQHPAGNHSNNFLSTGRYETAQTVPEKLLVVRRDREVRGS